MQLGKLSGLEKEKIEEELQQKLEFIKKCQEILADHTKVLDIVKTESLNLRDRFADDRKTEITTVSGDVDIEDLIPEEQVVLTKTQNGYIKRMPCDEYAVQNRGGRGIRGMMTRDDDIVSNMFICSSHDNVFLLSNLGRVYKLKAYEIPEGSRTSKGMNMINILPLMEGENIYGIMPCNDIDENHFITMVTKKGTIKRSSLDNYKNIRKTGIIALTLDEGDELAFSAITEGNSSLLISTKNGMSIRFDENDVRPMGRTARGVRAIKLKDGDEVVAMTVCDDNTTVLTITQTGFGRKSHISNYRLQSRGGKGITNYHCERYGKVASVIAVTDDDDVIMIASDGVIIRVSVAQISTFSRPAKGVCVKKVNDGVYILSASVAEHDEEEITEVPELPDADAGVADDINPEEEREEAENSSKEE